MPGALELSVLGAGPAFTDRLGAASAAHLVRLAESAVLLDLGQGAFPNLVRACEPASLVAVVVSHLHPDHFIDLVPLRHYLRYQRRPPSRVRVLAPAGLDERLDALLDEPGFTAAALDVEHLSPGVREIGPFRLEAAPVPHTAQSYAFRVSSADAPGAAGLVYSGDCADAAALLPLLRPGDTLLAEVSFGPGPVPADAQHLDAPAVASVAAAAGAAALLLTHLQMGFDPAATVDAAAARFRGPVRLVTEGDRVAV